MANIKELLDNNKVDEFIAEWKKVGLDTIDKIKEYYRFNGCITGDHCFCGGHCSTCKISTKSNKTNTQESVYKFICEFLDQKNNWWEKEWKKGSTFVYIKGDTPKFTNNYIYSTALDTKNFNETICLFFDNKRSCDGFSGQNKDRFRPTTKEEHELFLKHGKPVSIDLLNEAKKEEPKKQFNIKDCIEGKTLQPLLDYFNVTVEDIVNGKYETSSSCCTFKKLRSKNNFIFCDDVIDCGSCLFHKKDFSLDKFPNTPKKQNKVGLNVEELLKYAKENYTLGVKFKSSISDEGMVREVKEYDNESIISFDCVKCGSDKGIRFKDGIYNGNGGCSNPIIYTKEDGWCEIVERPVKEHGHLNNYKVNIHGFRVNPLDSPYYLQYQSLKTHYPHLFPALIEDSKKIRSLYIESNDPISEDDIQIIRSNRIVSF